ncbi:hypothetical protein EJB05_16407, partial [Eragrostis curvula]
MAAAAVVSVSMGVMKPVLTKLATLLGDEYNKLTGLRKEVYFLRRELSNMDALLEKMDSADELDPQAKKWRKDIIEMSYIIEDCIDDFMQLVGEADHKMGILQKASQYLRTLKDRHRLANQFQEIKTQVMEARERRKRYMFDQCISIITPVVVDPRMSALYKDSASLVGIDAPKSELVNWATEKRQQLKGLQLLETLDLSEIWNDEISIEIVNVPRLFHLAMPRYTRLPDWICKIKTLRTLEGFSLPIDSFERIIGLGEFNALSELNLYFPKGWASLPKATWMAALSISLEKLCNLKQLNIKPNDMHKPIALCADALSSLSPPFLNLERLYVQYGCTFSKVPRWIGRLHNLHELSLGAKQKAADALPTCPAFTFGEGWIDRLVRTLELLIHKE